MSQISDVTVIDIGSKSISAYRAERLSDENFAVKTYCEIDYSGYMDGEWLVPEEILPSLGKLLEKLERGAGRIKKVYVGLPAQFCHVRTIPVGVTFPKAKRVSAQDVKNLADHYDPFREDDAVVLHVRPITFLTNSGERTASPEHTLAASLKGELSYIACDKGVYDFLTQALSRLGIKEVCFMQSEYASAIHLFTKEEREMGVLLVDIGYLSTSVQYLFGEGVDEMKTFSLGGAFLSAGFSQGLNVSFQVAQVLASRLNLAARDEGIYTFMYNGHEYSFSTAEVNEMARECIGYIASYVKKAIDSLQADLPSNTPLYLTGGGLFSVRGAAECLAKYCGREVRYIQPNVANYAKPYYSTTVGLIFEAIDREKANRFGFIKRFFAK